MDADWQLLRNISSTIENSDKSWIDIASSIGLDTNDISKIKKQIGSSKEFVCSLTNKIWEKIFSYVNIKYESKYTSITNLSKLTDILSGCSKEQDLSTRNNGDINVVNLISSHVAEWKMLGRVLGMTESYLEQLRNDHQTCEQRNLEIMKRFSYPFDPEPSWSFWCEYLRQFDNGKTAIADIEQKHIKLLAEISVEHSITSRNGMYIGHPYEHLKSRVVDSDKNNELISVCLGTNDYPIADYQVFREFVQTQQQYVDTYNMLKDLRTINFTDKYCPILETLNRHLTETKDIGFAIKGYNFVNAFRLFKKGQFQKHNFGDTYFSYIVNDNIILYITKCTNSISHAFYHSMQNIKIANSLHEMIRSKNILQVNVIVYSDVTYEIFCKDCMENGLFVSEDVFTNIEKFSTWYETMLQMKAKFEKENKQLLTEVLIKHQVCESLKKDMITYEALETNILPSFTYCPDEQMQELKKMVILSPTQFEVLHTKERHILLRGSYGCGKSLVLLKKFEQVINNMDQSDIVYLICNDQQSKFYHYLKNIQSKYPMKNIIVISSECLVKGDKPPKLSLILNHVKNIWKERTVHIYIDEFNGSYINQSEIADIKSTLKCFENSHVVIALQSMEEKIVGTNNGKDNIDEGYQFKQLTNDTSFVCFTLDYSLRCSYEINEFVKAACDILELSNVCVGEAEHYREYSSELHIDNEQGRERYNHDINYTVVTKYFYNQNNLFGHSVKCGPVHIYHIKKKFINNLNNLYCIYIAILKYILQNISEEMKYTICTYDEELYNTIYCFLLNSSHQYKWTDDISEYVQQDSTFNLLLVDYASVRGYEFQNFIFLSPFGKRFLKYRMIECFTRASTNLFVVSHNTKTADRSVDNELLEKWKNLNCVRYFKIRYKQSADTLFINNEKKEIFYTEENISKLCLNKSKKYPWKKDFVKAVSTERSKKTLDDDIHLGLLSLISNDNIDMLKEYCLTHNVDMKSYRDSLYGRSLLHSACYRNAINTTRWLIDDCDIDVNCSNKFCDTPLCSASCMGNFNIVEILIQHGADVNVKNDFGQTALHQATYYGYLKIVKMLLDNGADVKGKNQDGDTALDLAKSRGHYKIVKLFEKV